jgi:predicted nucleotidyltransferase
MPDPVATNGLPASVETILRDFVAAARRALDDDLLSVLLFGSAAEGRLRAASDVNLMVVLARFTPERVDALREPLRLARAAIDLRPMFVLASELPAAAEAFAVKFEDIRHRHRVLFGPDLLVSLRILRATAIARLRQVLLNQLLRLRARYVETSLRPEQLAVALGEAAGPLRAAAATLLDLQGSPAPSSKVALERAAAATGVTGWEQTLADVSDARETRFLPAGVASRAMLTLLELTAALHARAEELAP